MLGWKKHKLESRLPGEISITSQMWVLSEGGWSPCVYHEGGWGVSTPECPFGAPEHTHILKECMGGRKLVLGQVLSWIRWLLFPDRKMGRNTQEGLQEP